MMLEFGLDMNYTVFMLTSCSSMTKKRTAVRMLYSSLVYLRCGRSKGRWRQNALRKFDAKINYEFSPGASRTWYRQYGIYITSCFDSSTVHPWAGLKQCKLNIDFHLMLFMEAIKVKCTQKHYMFHYLINLSKIISLSSTFIFHFQHASHLTLSIKLSSKKPDDEEIS